MRAIEERIVTLAGEGVELAISTDHNHHTDYSPTVTELHVGERITTVTGNEVSTPIGHMNAFPLDPEDPEDGLKLYMEAGLLVAFLMQQLHCLPGRLAVRMDFVVAVRLDHDAVRPVALGGVGSVGGLLSRSDDHVDLLGQAPDHRLTRVGLEVDANLLGAATCAIGVKHRIDLLLAVGRHRRHLDDLHAVVCQHAAIGGPFGIG